MKERPIPFSGEMVRAILEGRKAQTRRVMDPQPTETKILGLPGLSWKNCTWAIGDAPGFPTPYGQPGDRLWVRETLRVSPKGLWYYAADESYLMINAKHKTEMIAWAHHKEGNVCRSTHMPRWASRITLEITKVRVEMVKDITGSDIGREGFPGEAKVGSAYCWFKDLWDSLNAKRGFGWDANPWVWVIEFKRLP